MRLRPPLLVVAFLMLGPAVSQAFAVSVRDLVSLSREGVSDPVLVALIETDGSKFTLNADDIRSLRYQGLSDTVIVAMLRTSKVRAVPELDAPAPAEVADTIATPRPAPVVVNQHVVQKVEVQSPQRTVEYSQPVYVPVYVAVPTKPVETKKKEEPVYWGWGGQRRPDAWKEPVIIK